LGSPRVITSKFQHDQIALNPLGDHAEGIVVRLSRDQHKAGYSRCRSIICYLKQKGSVVGLGGLLVVGFGALALVGCAEVFDAFAQSSTASAGSSRKEPGARVPLPDRELLAAQPEPDCEVKSTTSDGEKSGVQTDPNADLALRIRLEYERECYRKAEMRARARLEQLQASTAETIKVLTRLEQYDRCLSWRQECTRRWGWSNRHADYCLSRHGCGRTGRLRGE